MNEFEKSVRSLVENAESACLDLGITLSTDPNIWRYIDSYRRRDENLTEGIPPIGGFDIHPDDELMSSDWFIAPDDLGDYRIGAEIADCCEAGTLISENDPNGELFCSVCEALAHLRNDNWRPLGWLTTTPSFRICWQEKRELIREELNFHLLQRWEHHPDMLCRWIQEESRLSFANQLELLEDMVDIVSGASATPLETLCLLLSCTSMESAGEELARVLLSISSKIGDWFQQDPALTPEMTDSYGCACRNYLLADSMPIGFAQALLSVKQATLASCETAGDVRELIQRAESRLHSI